MINDGTSLGKDLGALRNYVVQLVGAGNAAPGSPNGPEIEIDLDYNLKYVHVIETITAVTGYKKGATSFEWSTRSSSLLRVARSSSFLPWASRRVDLPLHKGAIAFGSPLQVHLENQIEGTKLR